MARAFITETARAKEKPGQKPRLSRKTPMGAVGYEPFWQILVNA
jgi:hypothetical protein